jgi:AcrR family transcriptional regulator
MSNKKVESLSRVVETAALLFSQRPFEEVQIAEIAARARCSSATIYEAFETKKGLFRAALLHHSKRTWPDIAQGEGPATLSRLIEFLADRIVGLSTPSMKNFWRHVSEDHAHTQAVMQKSVGDTPHLGEIVDEVQRCMDAGLLRAGDACAVGYLILAGTGYEPVVYGLLFDIEAACRAPAIIEMVLTPLVTDLGAEELAAYVASSKTNGDPDEADRPSLLNYMRTSPRASAVRNKRRRN